ncbi:MAG: cupin domain-containing protein [SAR202 cluster bacterium]|jgi:quercetin dioxygenase-like cupin family protein|nr:cupin domain-containing protein [SAR202 cluster bacterium]MDP6512041.1 cupin domain-containing protein [SAR202 cluster bacterium]MDP6715544.1 cupin domain-containing protein [SAR202 cluster bacterium]
MPIIDRENAPKAEIYPGVERRSMVDGAQGSQSLTVSEVLTGAGVAPPLHSHPTEEAMLVTDGTLQAYLGDEMFTVTAGQIVLAPPGVKHGFVNTSDAPATVYGIHPTNDVVTIWDEA